MRSLQRVVHRLGGYVRGRERCVRLQAITKTAYCVGLSKPAPAGAQQRVCAQEKRSLTAIYTLAHGSCGPGAIDAHSF